MTRSWQGAQPPWVFAGFVDKRVQASAEEQPRRWYASNFAQGLGATSASLLFFDTFRAG
ncbi:MAG: hypothetical protein QOJ51_3012 [Acidobacteriaceae bacterium]|jgi:hypothetical protein|nr:hypothetical protein [Acidobacteriaceae bacterium]